MTGTPLLTVEDLRVVFPRNGSAAAAVDTVSFDLAPGECIAIVGESGSGKSMICQAVIGSYRSQGASTVAA